ncbi:hypothetical protein CSA17_03545 [bacterium DOLJORAL78_65_58]|nr:MAG: hypothetical protein CSB20_08300 [bacterium DOLZORAL124_64_63]PIE76181.1 MAG: hypothetical protein CSA17_03545 [bacterium DOLJORAL78_65_58]
MMTQAQRLRALAGAALILLVLLAGCQEEENTREKSQEKATNVRILEMAPGSMTEYFEITGPIQPVRGADLSAEEMGPVVALSAAKGQAVQAGEVILRQQRDILEAEMKARESQADAAAFNLDKVQKLFDAQKISRLELLNTQAATRQARSAADVARRRFERAAIRAPFDGIVVDRYVELGQLLAPGQAAVRVIDPSVLKLEGYLTQEEVPFVDLGAEARVTLGDEGPTVRGTVAWVGMEADRATGKFKIEIRIPNEDGHLRSGLIGRAQLPKVVRRDVLTIPRDAVLPYRHGDSVFVVRGDRAKRRTLLLGPDQGNLVTVRRGLEPGDQLIVRGHRALSDSSLVRVVEVSTRPDGMLPTDPEVLLDAGLPGEEDR